MNSMEVKIKINELRMNSLATLSSQKVLKEQFRQLQSGSVTRQKKMQIGEKWLCGVCILLIKTIYN